MNSFPLCWSMGIKFYLSWVIKLKCSIEIDVYCSQTTVNNVLNELFYPFRAQQNKGQQYEFSDRQASQYDSRLDWSRDEFYQSLYENPDPKPVLFVSKAIMLPIGPQQSLLMIIKWIWHLNRFPFSLKASTSNFRIFFVSRLVFNSRF